MGKILGSALVQFLITIITALMALWNGIDDFSQIPMPAYAIAIGGALLAALKDIQAYLSKSPSALPDNGLTKTLVLLFGALFIFGCANTNDIKPNQAIGLGGLAVTFAADSALISYEQGLITADDKAAAKVELQKAKNALVAAHEVKMSGDQSLVTCEGLPDKQILSIYDCKLAQARAILESLRGRLPTVKE